jgi:hypothetical protein
MIAIVVIATAMLTAATADAAGRKACTELKQEIAARIDARGVKHYTLEIVDPAATGVARIVGSCDGGTQRIVYVREHLVPTQALPAVAKND